MRRGNSTPSACPLATLVSISLLGTAVDLQAATVRAEIIGLVCFFGKEYPLFQFMPPKERVIYIMQNKDYYVINNVAAFIYRSLLLVIVKTFSHPGWNMSIKLYYYY